MPTEPDNELIQSIKVEKFFSTQFIIFLITLIFLAGVAYSSFATKSELKAHEKENQAQFERLIEKTDYKFDKIMDKLEALQKAKVDKK